MKLQSELNSSSLSLPLSVSLPPDLSLSLALPFPLSISLFSSHSLSLSLFLLPMQKLALGRHLRDEDELGYNPTTALVRGKWVHRTRGLLYSSVCC